MKIILYILFFFSLTATAQSLKSNLIETENNVNTILNINQKAQFINSEGTLYSFKKINVTISGDVFCIDSLRNDEAKTKKKLFNLLDISTFDISQKQFEVIYKNNIESGKIIGINIHDWYALKKELYALIFICRTYSELDPKFKCD
jgi:hypothetical protein